MTLSALFHDVERKPLQEVEICGITDQSDQVLPGFVFVCISGARADGHRFAAQAELRGAAAVVAEHPVPVAVPQIQVSDARRAYAALCARFYGNPADRLCIAAVTGTNGKTTTAWMLHHILSQNGRKTGLLGTVSPSELHYTTPPPPELHRQFRQWTDEGITHAVLEASSQALDQQRLAGIRFACGIFTNLSPEHLDYHGSMTSYFRVKQRLFAQCDRAVVWRDSAWGERLVQSVPNAITVSAEYDGDVRLSDSENGDRLIIGNESVPLRIPMPGAYNRINGACAIAAAVQLGVPLVAAAEALSAFPPIPGRMECLPNLPMRVYIDYAHTPAALEQALRALRAQCTGRLITVFGCGGNRDRSKRPVMGAIAARWSDRVILTNDNPRTEDPEHILDEIEAGMRGPHDRIADRAQAIEAAVAMAEPSDTVLIAGKGHEQYQIIGRESRPFDERRIVYQAAEKHLKRNKPIVSGTEEP